MQSRETVYDVAMVHEANRRGFRAIFACAVLCMLALTAASNYESARSDREFSLEDIDTVVSRLEGIRELLTRPGRRTSMDELTLARARELARDIRRLLGPTKQRAEGTTLLGSLAARHETKSLSLDECRCA